MSDIDVTVNVHRPHADYDETEDRKGSAGLIRLERTHVFPGGNYRADRPVPTNTLAMGNPHSKSRESKAKLKRRRSSHDTDDNVFGSFSPTPAPPVRPQSKGPPRVIEGVFGSEFVEEKLKPLPRDDLLSGHDTEHDNDEDEEEEVDLATQESQWSPRNKGNQNLGDVENEQHRTFYRPTEAPTEAPTVAKKATNGRAKGSASKPLHPFNAMTAPNQDRNTESDLPNADNFPEPTKSRSRSVSYAESEQSSTERREAYVPSKELLAAIATIKPNVQHYTSNPAQHVANRSTVPSVRPFSFPQAHNHNVVSSNDPFSVPTIPHAVSNFKEKQKTKVDTLNYDKQRRRPFGGMDSHPLAAIPDIDLAQRTNQPLRRISSLPRQISCTPATSCPPMPMGSQSADPPSEDGFQMSMRPTTPLAEHNVWGEEERELHSRDTATVQTLEVRAGKTQNRSKRKRMDAISEDSELPVEVTCSEIWFEDGNIVLRAEATLFKVYRGALAKNSAVFQSILSIPPPPSGTDETFEGCPVVHLSDSALDVANVLQALFDPW